MTYQEQLEIEKLNKQIEADIITNRAAEFLAFYKTHNQTQTMNMFGVRTTKQLTKILTKLGYDFSIPKGLNKGKPATRSHESYVAGGRKSSETQKQHWAEKSEEEKQAWSEKQSAAHSSDSFKAKIKEINKNYQASLTEEQKQWLKSKKSSANLATWQQNRETILAKAYQTRKYKNNFNTSTAEDNYYLYLINKYGIENVKRNYTDERYQFRCDFYIVPTDTFIELNLHWSHGGHLYDKDNVTDQIKLNVWKEKAKTSKFYLKSIETWTVRDIKKMQTAMENDLKYIVFYNEAELYND